LRNKKVSTLLMVELLYKLVIGTVKVLDSFNIVLHKISFALLVHVRWLVVEVTGILLAWIIIFNFLLIILIL
jgi:hypothetical protein